MAMAMSRRPINPSRRVADIGGASPVPTSLHSKSRSSPFLSLGLIVVGAILLIGYFYRGSGGFGHIGAVSRVQGDFSCTTEVQQAIPFLKKAYGDSMRKVLHIGPDTCSVVSALLREEDTEAWGLEPYDIEDADHSCKSLVHKGLVRVADIKFSLPYRAKSFSVVIVSDALDYLSPKYLNKTLPELARVSADGLVIFTERCRKQSHCHCQWSIIAMVFYGIKETLHQFRQSACNYLGLEKRKQAVRHFMMTHII
nr:probable pectin methylesterase CGR2 isoform X2 [Coffea arabica]